MVPWGQHGDTRLLPGASCCVPTLSGFGRPGPAGVSSYERCIDVMVGNVITDNHRCFIIFAKNIQSSVSEVLRD